jgi:hypothetical protein
MVDLMGLEPHRDGPSGSDGLRSESLSAVTAPSYAEPMSRKVWTAAELDEMSPAEVDELFEASIVRDLDDVPPEFLARVRARVQERIDAEESSPQ